jgi:hypothetical protein
MSPCPGADAQGQEYRTSNTDAIGSSRTACHLSSARPARKLSAKDPF